MATKIPFGKTPPVTPLRPKPPRRVTPSGLVLHEKTPSIAEVDVTVPEAVGQAISALEESGTNGEVPLSLVTAWLNYIKSTSEFLDR